MDNDVIIGSVVVGALLIGALFMSKKKEDSESEMTNGSLHGYQGGRTRIRKSYRRTKRVKI
jgi:hypothetical protein